jgi:hypothetical protein
MTVMAVSKVLEDLKSCWRAHITAAVPLESVHAHNRAAPALPLLS